jgi:hypothetical protein
MAESESKYEILSTLEILEMALNQDGLVYKNFLFRDSRYLTFSRDSRQNIPGSLYEILWKSKMYFHHPIYSIFSANMKQIAKTI